MKPLSQIRSDFTPYRQGSFALVGTGTMSENINSIFKNNGLEPKWIFPEEDFLEDSSGHIEGESQKIIQNHLEIEPDMVVQLALDSQEKTSVISKKLGQLGVKRVISGEECYSVLKYMEIQSKEPHQAPLNHKKIQEVHTLRESLKLKQFSIQEVEKPILLLCLPPKTGDHSLINTFKAHNIPHHFIFHCPEAIDIKSLSEDHPQVKIITAVRDPLAENISLVFQMLGEMHQSLTGRALLHGELGEDFFRNGGDIQLFFDLFVQSLENPYHCGAHPIQRFVPQFQQNVFDYLAHDFDKNRGFSQLNEGNVQVFTYQIEKLNKLVPQLADFVGGDFSVLEKGNITAQKWVSDSYQEAQEKLIFSQRYFDKIYGDEWVNHVYSASDVEKFKRKWKNQVKERIIL